MRFESLSITSSAPPENAVKTSLAKKKLHMKDDAFPHAKPSKGKRSRENNNELQASSKKNKQNSAHKYEAIDLEEMLAETYFKDKETEISTPPIDNAKLSPAEGSEIRRSKRIKSRLPNKLTVSVKKWSDDQEMCLANALLDTCTPEGEVNTAAFYQRAKEQLRLEVSNYHLYEKMRRMRKKFWTMVKDKSEDKLVFRTSHEQVIFLLWEKIWGNLVAENPNSNEIEAENPNPYEFEAENPNPNEIDVENHNRNEIEAEDPNHAVNPNLPNNEAQNLKPKENDAENPKSSENPNSKENDAGNPKSSENPNSKENDAGKFNFGENLNPKENEAEKSLPQETHVENTIENGHFVEKSPRQEIHVEYARENGQFVDNLGLGLTRREIVGLESRIEAVVESSVRSMESKLEATIQSSVSFVVSAAGAANCQSSRSFGGEVGMGSGTLSSVTRTMKELMHGVDSVEEFPGLDTGEACELRQQWRKIKIRELKTFSEGLELLNNQCKMFLKIAETSNDRNEF